MTDVLSDLRKYGLISVPPATEAYMPNEDEQDDEQDDQQADGQDDQDKDGQDDDASAQTGDPETIEVPIEMKDKMLDLHRLAGEIFGMFTAGDDNVVDRYKKFDLK